MTDTTNTDSNITVNVSSDMAEKLKAAGQKAQAEKQARRERVVKGSHLLDKMREAAVQAGCSVEEQTAALKVSGGVKKKFVYIGKKGGVVSLSGFKLELEAVKQITEAEARQRHLGLVRGQIDFDKTDDEVMAAFTAALGEIKRDDVPAVSGTRTEKTETTQAAETPTENA